jgi:hydrophobic/amphiphilic exporter-1 (mainly G- bacteria), HAE1 family
VSPPGEQDPGRPVEEGAEPPPSGDPSTAGPPEGGGGGLLAIAISRPVGVLVGVILVLMFGILALVGLPIQLTPDIEIPTLTVETRWPGAAPAEVEQEILEEQEEALKDLRGLDRMVSEAASERGTITLELEVGADLDDALARVTNELAQVPSYPENADEPVVSTGDSAGPPLAVVLLQDPTGADVGQYRTWVEDTVLPPLERIPGVARIDLFGGRDSQVTVRYDPEALAARGVAFTQLAAALRASLRDLSGGEVDLGKRRYVVRTMARPPEVQDLEQVVLVPGGPDRAEVRLGDVATVEMGLRIRQAYVFGNDHESLALLFRREAGSNVLETTEAIRAAVDRIQADLLDREGLELRIVNDQTDYIYGALSLVRQNLLVGGALAAVVLLLFLRSLPAAGVVSVAIPVCVIGTALGMALLGRTVNVVSLAGVAFAVGMVVDNAIVVLENIDAWRKDTADPARAALEGTREVWGAILASTITTAAVFLPIITWQDEVGELLRDVAIAIAVAVFLSLAVSVLVIPSFAAKLLPRPSDRPPGRVARAGTRVLDGVAGTVQWLVARGWRSALLAIGAPAALVAVAVLLLPPMEYLPTGNRNFLFGVLVPPAGYSVDEMRTIGQRFQAAVDQHRGREVGGVPEVRRSFFVARPGAAFMGGAPVDGSRIDELVAFYRENQQQIPGVFGIASQASLFGRGIGASRSVDVDLTGPDLVALVQLGQDLMGRIREVLPGSQVRPLPSVDLGGPELQVVPRREDVARLGLSTDEVGLVVDALVDGAIVGEIAREGLPKLDVVVQPVGEQVESRVALENAPVATPAGRTVPLATLADVVERVGPTTIRRLERRRAITLQVSPPDDVALEEALARLRAEVVAPAERDGLPDGASIALAGTADDLSKAQARLGQVLLLAVVISFLLLAALYEDFLAPIVVLVTVPLAGAGGVLGLRLVDATLGEQPFDLLSAMGFVILIGVVVNNAILVVDGALSRMRGGMDLEAALVDAVRRRTRPIAMSALTSIVGLLPLVIFPGSGSELYRGVGAIVLGGLAMSTVLTLFVVPAVFRTVWALARRT